MQRIGSSSKATLDYLFHPSSIAIVGVSTDLTNQANRGRLFLEILASARYDGKVYPINPTGGEVFGLKVYPGIKDIPDTVDYVISAIPARHTPQLITECADKGVPTVHVFSAGFGETGTEEGKRLESEIAAIARQRNIRLIGPNCMGLYCPETRLSFCTEFPADGGSVGYLAQSGGHGVYVVMDAASRGVRFSKVISYGNACDLNETDFLEYLADDPKTKVIAAYIEGVKDGARFLKVLKRATAAKPVIILKGGHSETGARTAASHTNALAGSYRVWSSLLQQTNAIEVDTVEELADMLLLFEYMSPPRGRNAAIVGVGGGASVLAADDCSRVGLAVPPLPIEISKALVITANGDAGKIFRNPIDMLNDDQQVIQEAIRMVARWDQIDFLLIQLMFDVQPYPAFDLLGAYTESIVSLRKEVNKPSAIVLHGIITPESQRVAFEKQAVLYKAGFPVFPSIGRAANAISKFIRYHREQDRRGK